jgi:SH3 domain protein
MNKTLLCSIPLAGFIALLSSASFSVQSYAGTRYVTDNISIPLRSDKDNQSGVLKNNLTSGTKLKFIREEEDTTKIKWSQVITADGVEGWIRSQNLINEPTAALKLAAISSGSSNVIELQKQAMTCKEELTNLQATYQTLLKDTEDMRTATTSDINMEQENQNMHREYQLLQTERDVLKAENDQLKKSDEHKQRLFGGILILCGVILSFILQMFGKRKRHSEWH